MLLKLCVCAISQVVGSKSICLTTNRPRSLWFESRPFLRFLRRCSSRRQVCFESVVGLTPAHRLKHVMLACVFFVWSHPELVEVLIEMQMFKRLVTDKGIVFAFLSNNSIHKQAPPPSVAQGSFQLLISQHRMKYCYAQMLVVL